MLSACLAATTSACEDDARVGRRQRAGARRLKGDGATKNCGSKLVVALDAAEARFELIQFHRLRARNAAQATKWTTGASTWIVKVSVTAEMVLLSRAFVLAASCVLFSSACADDGFQPQGFENRSDPSLTASGRVCRTNADCVGSPAERQFKYVRCRHEIYCSAGSCFAECQDSCSSAREDVSSCGDAGLCQPLGQGISACTRKPISCEDLTDCPASVPPGSTRVDAGADAWRCEDEICRYPGYEYRTR